MLKDKNSKLKSVRGASLVIALLVFLLAALTGTAVFTMATSNAGRYTTEKRQQQAYLNVSSAVRLVRGELEKFSVEVSCTASRDGNEVKSDEKFSAAGSDLFANMSRLLDQCDKYFVAYIQKEYLLKPATAPGEQNIQFRLGVKDSSAIGNVTVKLTVDKDLTLVLRFSHSDADSESLYATELRVKLLNSSVTAERRPDGITNYTRTLQWDNEHATITQVRQKNS